MNALPEPEVAPKPKRTWRMSKADYLAAIADLREMVESLQRQAASARASALGSFSAKEVAEHQAATLKIVVVAAAVVAFVLGMIIGAAFL